MIFIKIAVFVIVALLCWIWIDFRRSLKAPLPFSEEARYEREFTNEEISAKVCRKLPLDGPEVKLIRPESLYLSDRICLGLAKYYGFVVIVDVKCEEVIIKDKYHRMEIETDPSQDDSVYTTANVAILSFLNKYY